MSVVVIALALAPCAAQAAGPENLTRAGELFRAGRAAYDKGQFEEAARSFEQAFESAPRTPAIYAAALAWESARDRPRAAHAFRVAVLAGDLPEKDARDAEERLAALTMALGELVLRGPAGGTVSVGTLDNAPTPARVFVEPGRHEVAYKSGDGKRQTRSVSVDPGHIAFLELENASRPAAAKPDKPVRSAPEKNGSSMETRRLLAWTALGGAAVALGASAYLWNDALSARDEWEADPRRSNLEDRDRAQSRQTWTNVALGAGVVLGSVGAGLWVSSGTASRDEAPAAAQLHVHPGGGRVVVPF